MSKSILTKVKISINQEKICKAKKSSLRFARNCHINLKAEKSASKINLGDKKI